MGDFRKNVDPSFRRKTNQSLAELTSLKKTYTTTQSTLNRSEAVLENELAQLEAALASLEAARDALSEAQQEIDADYLPEGAQPRARIDRRDKLLLV